MVMLSAKVPPELAASVRERALREDRSISAVVRRALRTHLETSVAPAGNQGDAKAHEDGVRHDAG